MSEKEQNNTTKSNNMGLAIAIGAGLGIVFGKFLFGDVGVGLVIGAGLGIVLVVLTNLKLTGIIKIHNDLLY